MRCEAGRTVFLGLLFPAETVALARTLARVTLSTKLGVAIAGALTFGISGRSGAARVS